MHPNLAGISPNPVGSADPAPCIGWLAAIIIFLAMAAACYGADDSLEFGLAPYISARPLLSMFHPLAQHLEQRLKRRVLLVTAPTLREFDERTLGHQYDVAMMAPQSARLAQKQAGYVPLLRVSNDLYGVFLVPTDSQAHSLSDLAGEPVVFPDRFTATAHLGKEALLAAGLDPAQAVYRPGFQDSILVLLARGEFRAALMNSSAFFQMRDDQKTNLRVLAETRRISHVIFVARPDMPPEGRAAIRTAIQDFMEHSEQGKAFIAQTGLAGVRIPSEAELRALDALAHDHKRLLDDSRDGGAASR